MKPPICRICSKRLDPSRSFAAGPEGLVRFADYSPPAEDTSGRPSGTAWFCRRHFRAAKSLQDRTLPSALMVLERRRQNRRILGLGLLPLVLLGGITAWNVIGPVSLPDVKDGDVAHFTEGRWRGTSIDSGGVRLAARWAETQTTPTWNPLRILRQQLRYGVRTEGYDLVLWMEPEAAEPASRLFALYQSDRTLLLRIEFEGRNRVLDASFSVDELERALDPYRIRPDSRAND